MRGLHSTITRLAKLRAAANDGGHGDGKLRKLASFGPNPGKLRALTYLPDGLGKDAALVVVDEHPVPESTRAALEACRAAGADLVEHGANRGIGAALNTGVARLLALRPGLTDVLTLDQDSVVPEGYVAALLAARSAAAAAGVRVGMVAPHSVGSILRLPAGRRAPGSTPARARLLPIVPGHCRWTVRGRRRRRTGRMASRTRSPAPAQPATMGCRGCCRRPHAGGTG